MFIFNLYIPLLFIAIFVNNFSILRSQPSLNDSKHFLSANKINAGRRKSEIKCNEYSEAVKKKIHLLRRSESESISISIPCKPPINLLISGGEGAELGEFPHMAAVGSIDTNGRIQYYCGGALISENWVLTAAHCTQYYSRKKPSVVRLGSNKLSDELGEVIKIIDIIRHPEYKPPNMYSDVALLKLHKPVTFRRNIQPACLHLHLNKTLTAAWATGWGEIEYGDGSRIDNLQKVRLDIIDNAKCSLKYKEVTAFSNRITSSMICAGDLSGENKRDTCRGDSGGPLQILHHSYCLYELVGITSFGKLCAIPEFPGVYMRISHYLDWIEATVWP